MADDNKDTYSRDEHIAILQDRVARETSDLTAERDNLSTEKAELETQLDVAVSGREAAEQRATEAEQALEAYKAEVTQREEALARKDQRLTKVREAASHLDDTFFADEARVARIVAMSDEAFDGYVADLGATGRPAGTSTNIPRETAMAGAPATSAAATASAGSSFLLRGFVAPKEG